MDDYVRSAGQLEVFIDRSSQNGLHEAPTSFTRYDLLTPGAPALKDGKPVRLGESVRQRIYSVCETTRYFGDWLLLADLAAHLWGRNGVMRDRIRHEKLKSAVEDLGMFPGIALFGDLVNAVAEVNAPKLAAQTPIGYVPLGAADCGRWSPPALSRCHDGEAPQLVQAHRRRGASRVRRDPRAEEACGSGHRGDWLSWGLCHRCARGERKQAQTVGSVDASHELSA